ncbi:tyrosine-type recombinase/integrase [Ferrimonas aestuarii]|uniref:Site-specific integrase n=1 Tax=Ferrimonas aestuarii TaxID=2569539 RepID=A0A4V5NWH5_9GAMM|nr:site-specific integrase [Ferrimonas aestuarii]TKB57452.1 site-specific integrase [Ferrimonas aestuarii]
MTTELIATNIQYPSLETSEYQLDLNPATLYLQELGSDLSRQKMISYLNLMAKLMGAEHYRQIDWGKVRKPQVLYLLDRLRQGALLKRRPEKGRSPNTLNLYLALLKGVARRAYELGLYEHRDYSQIQSIKRFRGTRIKQGSEVEPQRINQLLTHCKKDNNPKGERDFALLTLLFNTGLRRAEIVALQMQDLDLNNRQITVIGKGNRQRMVYLNGDCMDAITRYLDHLRGHHSGALFQPMTKLGDLKPNSMTPQAVKFIIDSRSKAAQVESFNPHDSRRTFATQLLRRGIDLHTVQKLMGHASIDTTRHYDMRDDQVMRDAVDGLNWQEPPTASPKPSP